MAQQLERFLSRLPGVRRIQEARQALCAECERLRGEIEEQQRALASSRAERNELEAQLTRLEHERSESEQRGNEQAQALKVISAERDELKQHLTRIDGERVQAEQRGIELGEALEQVSAQAETLHADFIRLQKKQGFAPPGHFYSPIPDLDEIAAREEQIFGAVAESIPGVDLRIEDQRELLERFATFYTELPFSPEPSEGLRYHYENPAYSYSDAIMLHCMIRHLEPRRIVEIGSGYSSCMTLDTNDLFFDGQIETTFIEPYPELLHGLMKPGDAERVRIIDRPVQEVAPETFEALGVNDILFVDSTHVSKIGSDVNHIFFEVLPRLNEGVHIHFHDIGYPFEYPKEWIFEGRAWNETYMLRAFLSFNPHFRVLLMNTYMHRFHREFFDQHMPLCTKNPGGSIWMRKQTPAGR